VTNSIPFLASIQMINDLLLLPRALLEVLDRSQAPWGWIALARDGSEHLCIATGYSAENGPRLNTYATSLLSTHYMRRQDDGGWQAVWYHVESTAHDLWEVLVRIQGSIPAAELENFVQGWRQPGGYAFNVITIAVRDGVPEARAWMVAREFAQPIDSAVVDENRDPASALEPGWPVNELRDKVVTVVGVGSIGSAAADALARYAVRKIILLDPDRFLPHNIVRHRAHPRWLGCFKVNAAKRTLEDRYPYLHVEALPLDVVHAADIARVLFRESDVIICCVDGISARVASSHLARWARTPLILACVLDDGSLGELIRLRPISRSGCLRCQRDRLRERGELDPEPGIDLPYGTGSRHRPMTAVAADLFIVGQLAAKAAVSTLLEASGHPDQRLPGDHGIIALRPPADLAAPFDLARAGEIRWLPVGPPVAGCATCEGT
jgi:molybdopterin-synthase adenylyltransferase